MKSINRAFWLLVFASSLVLSTLVGCKSHTSIEADKKTDDSKTQAQPSHPIGGTYCLETFAQQPAQANTVHFSYKETESDGSFKDYEGDLAGDNIDSTVHEKRVAGDMDREMAKDPKLGAPPVVDGFVNTTRTLHSTRSDPSGWSMGSGGQVHAFAPWGLFIAKPNVKQVGSEKAAGFDTLKYSVDTDGQGQLDKMPLSVASGLKDYTISGNAWVDSKQDCILQYNIDYHQVMKDGTSRNTHYEGATTTK